MTSYSTQIAHSHNQIHNHTQVSVQSQGQVSNPSSFAPTNFPRNNTEMMAQAAMQMKANHMANPNINLGVGAIPSTSTPSHMMCPSAQVQPLPTPQVSSNVSINDNLNANMIQQQSQSQYNPSIAQNHIMHKPNMHNMTKMSMGNLNINPNPVAPPSTSPSTLQTICGLNTLNVPAIVVNISKPKTSKKSKAKNNSSIPINPQANSSNVGVHGENTGRWTQEEHRLFLEGLEKHGKGWKKIASLIKSRTVVQIRTHAQKYFQKLAKARHNGEEGDVSMEGRDGVGMNCVNVSGPGGAIASGMSIPALSNEQLKRRNNAISAGGTKRKSIESVVTSAQREGKRLKEVNDPLVMPSISPCLAPYVMHPGIPGIGMHSNHQTQNNQISDTNTSLEESLYRFLTPMTATADYSIQPPPSNQVSLACQSNGLTSQSNDLNCQNQFIVLPNNMDHMQYSEGSPTCVGDIPNFPSFPSSKLAPNHEPPSWYARGADVDELLHDADALNWLADTGDLDEVYSNTISLTADNCTPNPVCFNSSEVVSLSESEGGLTSGSTVNIGENTQNLATDALPPVVSSMSSEDIHTLPNLFDPGNKSRAKLSTPNLFSSVGVGHQSTGNLVDENFSVFDSAMDEQAFVSALLESNENAALSISNAL